MTSYSVHYSRRMAECEARESFALQVGPVQWSEDGAGWPVHTVRAFNIAEQCESGYMWELREPFISETASAIFDCTDETEPEGDDE